MEMEGVISFKLEICSMAFRKDSFEDLFVDEEAAAPELRRRESTSTVCTAVGGE